MVDHILEPYSMHFLEDLGAANETQHYLKPLFHKSICSILFMIDGYVKIMEVRTTIALGEHESNQANRNHTE